MAISLSSRRLGDVTIVTCSGRIVGGAESAALHECLGGLLPGGLHVILHLGDVSFIDSSGLGLLVRFLKRARAARGTLLLCAPSPSVAEVLRVTKLDRVLGAYDSEAAAIAAVYQPPDPGVARLRSGTDVLCVNESDDVQEYVGGLLGQAGCGVLAAGTLRDGLMLLEAARPKLVIVSARVRAESAALPGDPFSRLTHGLPLVELPADFPSRDAGEAGRHLLEELRASGVTT